MITGVNFVKGSDKFANEMAKVRIKFLEKLKNWLPEIEAFFKQLDNSDLPEIDSTKSKFHQLSGSAKTFGFPDITTIAGKIETALEKLQKNSKNIAEIKKLFTTFFTIAKKVLESNSNLVIAEPKPEEKKEKLSGKQYKIFVVDDDDLVNSLLEQSFKKEGHQIMTFIRGEQALEKLKTEKPDLIILDINMPGMNGIEVLEKLKSDEKYKNIPVIMLTKKSDNEDILSGFASGAIDYITKPFKVEDLVMRAMKILEMQNIKILIVDDDELLVDVIEKKLLQQGYAILKCYNGKDVLKIVEEQKPNLILLDIMLPGMDGITILKHVKANPVTANIPVIVLTAKRQKSNVIKCLENGAHECITKPFDLEEITVRIESILQRK